jgi:hypothetical protein
MKHLIKRLNFITSTKGGTLLASSSATRIKSTPQHGGIFSFIIGGRV